MKITPALFIISAFMVLSGCIVLFFRFAFSGDDGKLVVVIPYVGIFSLVVFSILIGILHLMGLRNSEQRYNLVNIIGLSVIMSLVSGLGLYYL